MRKSNSEILNKVKNVVNEKKKTNLSNNKLSNNKTNETSTNASTKINNEKLNETSQLLSREYSIKNLIRSIVYKLKKNK